MTKYEIRVKQLVAILKEFKPKKIYTYGSWVWGNAHEDSDIDLAMIVGKGIDTLQVRTNFALELLKDKNSAIAEPDLKVIPEDVFNYRLSRGDPFVSDIAKGRIVYEGN